MNRDDFGRPEPGPPLATGQWQGRNCRFRTDRLVLKIKAESASPGNLAQLFEQIRDLLPGGSQLQRPPSRSGRAVFSLPAGSDVIQLANQVSEHAAVLYAEPDMAESAADDTA